MAFPSHSLSVFHIMGKGRILQMCHSKYFSNSVFLFFRQISLVINSLQRSFPFQFVTETLLTVKFYCFSRRFLFCYYSTFNLFHHSINRRIESTKRGIYLSINIHFSSWRKPDKQITLSKYCASDVSFSLHKTWFRSSHVANFHLRLTR